MFCNQCEQTAQGVGCTKMGVCGKSAEIAKIQDSLVFALRGLALVTLEAGKKGLPIQEPARLVAKGLFMTITNVNFDKTPLMAMVHLVVETRKALAQKANISCSAAVSVCGYVPLEDEKLFMEQAKMASTLSFAADADCNALAQTLLFGLKGVSAYLDHAAILGQESDAAYTGLMQGLVFGFDGKTPALNDWVGAVLQCGQTNLLAMELLDAGNTGTYGHPEPTKVSLAPVVGKAILVTGHDLKDLHVLLEQTQGKGISIYTHGEMLPAHAYPELKKFPHLAGHFGTAWQNQHKEFPDFPGAILFTTNCIQRPANSYMQNVFTTGLVGWPGVTHVENGDFTKVINHALAQKGFTASDVANAEAKTVMVGFGRNTVIGVADTVIEGVQSGAIKHFFLVGGCDGAKPGRNYYTEFVEKTPADSLILTLACGKFRFFDKDLGTINGIPRLLDVGQCNDAYSAVKIALALADAFKCDVNALPLSIVLSWYEQKAVAVLLTLLSLGIKGILLGPSLPAFISPAVLKVLVDTFDIKPTTTADADLKMLLKA